MLKENLFCIYSFLLAREGYHFIEGPYVEYAGILPPEEAVVADLVTLLNDHLAALVQEKIDTKVKSVRHIIIPLWSKSIWGEILSSRVLGTYGWKKTLPPCA